jgi:excinuclease UvrABC ATPase subunit
MSAIRKRRIDRATEYNEIAASRAERSAREALGTDLAMYDFSVPNTKPGKCAKCNGTGRYSWGAVVNGRPTHSGQCHSCQGTGKQTRSDIARNNAYNRHKIASLGC